jgi:hypothetical protein
MWAVHIATTAVKYLDLFGIKVDKKPNGVAETTFCHADCTNPDFAPCSTTGLCTYNLFIDCNCVFVERPCSVFAHFHGLMGVQKRLDRRESAARKRAQGPSHKNFFFKANMLFIRRP